MARKKTLYLGKRRGESARAYRARYKRAVNEERARKKFKLDDGKRYVLGFKVLQLFGVPYYGNKGRPWPLPRGDRPGRWVTVRGQLIMCEWGLHAALLTLEALQKYAHYGPAIHIVELDTRDLQYDDISKVVARRARLLATVESNGNSGDLRTLHGLLYELGLGFLDQQERARARRRAWALIRPALKRARAIVEKDNAAAAAMQAKRAAAAARRKKK